jgi:hypothetical protein
MDDDRLRVDYDRMRKGADVDAAIEAGLSDRDRHADIGGEGWSGDRGRHRGEYETPHGWGSFKGTSPSMREDSNSMTASNWQQGCGDRATELEQIYQLALLTISTLR